MPNEPQVQDDSVQRAIETIRKAVGEHAVSIADLSSRVSQGEGAQKETKDTLRRHASRLGRMEAAQGVISAKLDTVLENQQEEKAERKKERENVWAKLGTLTPWLFLVGMLAYNYILKGPVPGP